MDIESEKMHLQSLEEYVLDEGKIVTYRWLSKVLNIHVNLSKELLSKFASDPAHESSVYLTYLVSGKLKDGTHGVLVIEQDKFDDAKSNFQQIVSQHVYSMQKKKEAPSENLLYLVNSEKVENEVDVSKQIGSIKCTESVQRAANELSSLRLQSISKPGSSDSSNQVKKAPPQVESTKKESEKSVEVAASEKSSVAPKSNKPKQGSGGIASMFAAQAAKPSKQSPSNNETKAKPPAKKAGGINSFFSKVAKPENEPTEKAIKTEQQDSSDLSMEVDVPAKESSVKEEPEKRNKQREESEEPEKEIKKEESDLLVSVSEVKEKASSSKANAKSNKKKSKSKAVTKKEKPRKRIKVIDSDSSDDMFGDERESSPEPDSRTTPPPSRKIEDSDDEIIPPTPQPQPGSDQKNRRKRKVVKDKSFMDDDGYMVTEKVTVYESCSDREEEAKENVKKPKEETTENPPKESEKAAKDGAKDKKKPVKKTASPVKNKQASLMSFFKRA